MEVYHLAIDIGATSGRHMLGYFNGEKIVLEEIHRFKNELRNINGKLCWDLDNIFNEIIIGLKKCKEVNKIPKTMGIDTWGVDFVLLNKENKVLSDFVSYRDDRTLNMQEQVFNIISKEELYKKTGIQDQRYNTIFQLMALKLENKEMLLKAENMLMIPEYFNFLLTGIIKNEYTLSTTTGLINANTKTWDFDIIEKLEFPKIIFKELFMPTTLVGNIKNDIQEKIGFNVEVILTASHDTASAVLSIPTNEKCIFLSSGTWSLMGVELKTPNCTIKSMNKNFTNEGGFNYKFRYLKNIIGMMIIESVKKEIGKGLSYDNICKLAEEASILSIIDCNDNRFLTPYNMTESIINYCKETNQQIPNTIGEFACVIYNSMAYCYKESVGDIEELTGETYNSIYIVGGGSKANYLNRLTEKYCNKEVVKGPVEATAIGNLIAQMIYLKEIPSIDYARNIVK